MQIVGMLHPYGKACFLVVIDCFQWLCCEVNEYALALLATVIALEDVDKTTVVWANACPTARRK